MAKPVHRGVKTFTGIYDYCSNSISNSPFSFNWKEVTCKNCIKKKDEKMKPAENPEVTRMGALSMQVCVPTSWTNKQVKAFADANNTCGTENGWSIRKNGDRLFNGAAERVSCASRKGYVHIMLDA